MARDPICGMEVDIKKAVILKKEGETFYFCSQHCRDSFLDKGKKMGQAGHAVHHAHMVEDFKRRFWISLVATIPVLILSPVIQIFLKISLRFTGDMLILFGISTFVYFYGGLPFLKGMFDELKDKQPGMMTLIALAVSVAYGYSSLVVFGLKGEVFFWSL